MKKISIIALSTFVLTGCGTLASIGDDNKPYSGVRFDADLLSTEEVSTKVYKPLGIIDLPFSFVGDTVLLPVQLIRWAASDGKE